MLDIRQLREDPEGIKTRLQTRGGESWRLVDEVLACDERRRAGETEKQTLQSDRNRLSKEIGAMKKEGKDSSELESTVRGIGERIKAIGEEADAAEAGQTSTLLQIPNLPHAACPVGSDETANPLVRDWGAKPEFTFAPKDHVEIGTRLGLFDFEAGTKISSGGFVVFTGVGAKLERALIQFLLDLHTEFHGYDEVAPPHIINRDCMFGTGQLPKFEDDMYGLEENAFFLAPTAEVPVTNLSREMILKESDLPVKVTAYTPCFRREKMSAGRDVRGIKRGHQFDKVEMYIFCKPEDSETMLQKMPLVLCISFVACPFHYSSVGCFYDSLKNRTLMST